MPEYIICKPTRLAPTTVHSHCEYMRRRRAATFVKDATNKIVLESGLDLSDELKDYAIRSLTDSAKKLFSKHSVKDLLEKPASIIGEIEQVREPPLRDIYIDLYPKDINDEPGLWVGTHHESDEGPLPGFEVITYFWTGQRMLFTGASWQEWEKALHSERESNIHHKVSCETRTSYLILHIASHLFQFTED